MATEPETPFLAAIHKATPNGEWISVQHHPDGDWSVANTPTETPSPDVMGVWESAFAVWDNDPITPSLDTKKADEAAATVIAEAKARWEREAFEKAAQVAERLAFPKASSVWQTACRDVADQIRAHKEPRP